MARINFLKAHNGDCIHIENNCRNVIIDSGETCDELESLVEAIKRNGNKIDLLVITHYDSDHIKCICNILENLKKEERKQLIGKVWFNATKLGYSNNNNNNLSARDAHRLASLLMEADIDWISNVTNGMKEPLGSDTELEVIYGGQLYTGSKDSLKLSNIKCDWNSSFHELEEFIDDNVLDKSETNAQSMILVLKSGKKRVLLPGDAIPEHLYSSLNQYMDGKVICFDLVKLPHHGSYKNVTKQILSTIRCSEYVISTDGKFFCHPDKKALLKILKWGNRNKRHKLFFHMNYYDELFSNLNITNDEMCEYKFECDGNRTFDI